MMRNTSPEKSSALKQRLIGLVAFAAFIFLVNFLLTQWIASRMGYHPVLGSRWFGLYQPFAWFGWQQWYATASMTFNIAYLITLIAMSVGLGVIVVVHGIRTRSAR